MCKYSWIDMFNPSRMLVGSGKFKVKMFHNSHIFGKHRGSLAWTMNIPRSKIEILGIGIRGAAVSQFQLQGNQWWKLQQIWWFHCTVHIPFPPAPSELDLWHLSSPGSGRKAQRLQGLVKQNSEDLRRFQLIIFWKTRAELYWHSYFNEVLLPSTVWISIFLLWVFSPETVFGFQKKVGGSRPSTQNNCTTSPGQCCFSSRPWGSFVSWQKKLMGPGLTAEFWSQKGEGLGPKKSWCFVGWWWYLTQNMIRVEMLIWRWVLEAFREPSETFRLKYQDMTKSCV